MPELPEVELITRSLNKLASGRTIESAELLRERLAPATPPADFAGMLKNAHINFVHRRGKHILFDLAGGMTLITHLRMSGRFSILPPGRELPKFTHALFHLADGERLVFDDQRHFGLMKIVPTALLAEIKELSKLGPEPLSDDFSAAYLHSTLKASRRSLKELLIDQSRVCGVGNIYASEALFAAGIHPGLRGFKVSGPRARRLHESIRAVLEIAINFGAGLPVDPENLEGNYFSSGGEPAWHVYDRESQPCRICSAAIKRLVQAGRSTYYCSTCQRR